VFYNQLIGGDSLKTFGERLRELRRENHMTGDELGKKFNVTKTAISYWENGKSFPDEETIKKFADFFQVSTDYILGKSDIRNPYENHQRISESIKDDKELLEFWEVLKEREDLQLLFKQTKQMTEKDIRQIIKIIKAIEDEEDAQN